MSFKGDSVTTAKLSVDALFLAITLGQLAPAPRWFLTSPRPATGETAGVASNTWLNRQRMRILMCGTLFWFTSRASSIATIILLSTDSTLKDSSWFSSWLGLTTCTAICNAVAFIFIYTSFFLIFTPATSGFRSGLYGLILIITFALSISQAAVYARAELEDQDTEAGFEKAVAGLERARHLGTAASVVWILVNSAGLFEVIDGAKIQTDVIFGVFPRFLLSTTLLIRAVYSLGTAVVGEMPDFVDASTNYEKIPLAYSVLDGLTVAVIIGALLVLGHASYPGLARGDGGDVEALPSMLTSMDLRQRLRSSLVHRRSCTNTP